MEQAITAFDAEIGKLSEQIGKLKEERSMRIKDRPREVVEDYVFEGQDGQVRLSGLFGDQEDLVVLHNMGPKCNYCSLWADGFNGELRHIASRTAFVLVNHETPGAQREFAASRGWSFTMASAKDNTFSADMGYLGAEGLWPGLSAFRKEADGTIVRVGRDFLGPGDDYCGVWHIFDLLKDGPNGWEPS